MKLFTALAIVWVVLALTTLDLVIHNNDSLLAAFVAWVGGLITYRLASQIWTYYKRNRTLA